MGRGLPRTVARGRVDATGQRRPRTAGHRGLHERSRTESSSGSRIGSTTCHSMPVILRGAARSCLLAGAELPAAGRNGPRERVAFARHRHLVRVGLRRTGLPAGAAGRTATRARRWTQPSPRRSSAAAVGERFADADLLALAAPPAGPWADPHAAVADGLALSGRSNARRGRGLVVAAGNRPDLLQRAGGLPADLRLQSRAGMDGGAATMVRAAAADGCFHRRLPGASGGSHAVERRLAGCARGSPPRLRALSARTAAARLPRRLSIWQGEIHRLRGDWSAARRRIRLASRMGCEPQPGLPCCAWARVAPRRRRFDPAGAACNRRSAGSPAAASGRRADHARRGRSARRRAAPASELDELAAGFAMRAIAAMAAQASGVVALAGGRPAAALVSLRQAHGSIGSRSRLPSRSRACAACSAAACHLLGDLDGSALEFCRPLAKCSKGWARCRTSSASIPSGGAAGAESRIA